MDTAVFNAAYKQATAAYTNSASAVNSPDSGGFSGLVGEAVGNMGDMLHKAEINSNNALTGKADITDVVTSVSEAEMALQTIMAVRDRAISAYQDIIKMPI